MRLLPRGTAPYDEMKTERLASCRARSIHPRNYAMKLPMITKIVATFALLGLAVWLGTSEHFYKSALLSLFFGVTLASVVLIHFRVRPSWPDALCVIGGAALFTVIDFGFLHFAPSLAGIASYLGISSLSILGLRAIWSEGAEQEQMALAFVPALLFVTSDWGSTILLGWTEKANPRVLDLYLFSFDSSLRVQIAFLTGQAYALWPWFRSAGMIFYIGLPMVIGLVYAGQLLHDRTRAVSAMIAFLITGPVGVVFYNLFPAVGPIHIFLGQFPWKPIPAEQVTRLLVEPIAVAGLRNCMPSLHMTWVLLAWWYSRGLSIWERGIAMAFVVFTIFATMGIGEHYSIDLVVAFPFAVFLQGLCALGLRWNDRARAAAVVYGFLLTIGWIGALRFALKVFWISPVLPWAGCILTVASAVFVQRWLEGSAGSFKSIEKVSTGSVPVAVS
jgi:PAP2 superfamily